MHPIAFTLFGLPVHWYGVLIALAMLVGLSLFQRLGRQRGLPAAFLSEAGLWMLLGGMLGARIDQGFHDLPRFHDHPFWILNPREGGFAIHGALFGGMLGNFLRFRKSGYPVLEGLDLAAASVLPSMAIGRLGCLLQGCCIGLPAALPWAVSYPDVLGARHPVQLYEAGLDLLLWPLVLLTFWRAPRQGQTTCALLGAYAVIRFTAEFFRASVVWGPLTEEQWGSLAILGLAVAGWQLTRSSWGRSRTGSRACERE